MSFQSRPKKSREPLNEQSLYNYAVKALGRHMRTEVELRRLMQSRVEPGERGHAIVAGVIARLKEQKYLDDKSYAETFTRLRQENEKLGQRSVRQKLAQKGVPREVAEQAPFAERIEALGGRGASGDGGLDLLLGTTAAAETEELRCG